MEHEIKEYKGYRYVTLRMTNRNHVCGYVEIPRGHYLFGKDYSDNLPELKPYAKEVMEGQSGKRGPMTIIGYALRPEDERGEMSPEMFFDVHGSITFSDRLLLRGESVPIFDWAMGFDTAHFNDDETTQTHEFCEQECRLFIDQLVEIDEELKNGK